ncbi:family 2 glycosyl transferase [Mariniplasma anaerobium]|uniref:Family 2 glycosyl transferase n=1 Tax=Mariniplasma anaerobium TaxID=2735436 RepID=A0A7U9XVX0_9MOLU|nr:family 2 glycosyl transferase [Mariniplasma anaerobium]BCR35766.1 hypothetical protein MPAN_006590 [Mariniplasma anaerobium]
MKKYILIVIIMLISALLLIFFVFNKKEYHIYSKVGNDSIQVLKDNEYQDIFLKGVNIGATKPGFFPGELAITKNEYFQWFQMIKDMNANTVRVYTILSPNFYDALYDFNKDQEEPLYFMQGVWINEDDIVDILDVYGQDNKIINNFISDSKSAVDVINGNAQLPIRPGFASGSYTKDVSMYMVGWLLGLEWDPGFVINTNENNFEKIPFQGIYAYNTPDSSPFEIFLAEIAEEIISYEVDTYNNMRPLSFVNWLTTDPLSHPNEPFVSEDEVSVDVEHIKATENYEAGFFASYHIYPYYPEFMNYSLSYSNYIDNDGNINPYKGYLEDLKNHHSMPIVVGEFGIPSSRGKAHDALYTGFNQGNISEEMQGEMVVDLAHDIYESGYAGAMIFSWQDEWFKRTWNTNQYDLSHRRPFWSNIQTNEQYFGLLAFDPGEESRVSYADGDMSEWSNQDVILTQENQDISIKSDARYLYILINDQNFDFDTDKLYIAIDTLDGQGNDHIIDTNISFSRDADFVIEINDEDDSRILVDQYYDAFQYLHSYRYTYLEKTMIDNTKNSGVFNSMNLALSYPLYLPEEETNIPFQYYETGKLVYGNANPSSDSYNSLSDFYVNNHSIELQIPWQLLNFTDPSTKSIMSDIKTNTWLTSQMIDSIHLGWAVVKDDTDAINVQFGSYLLSSWEYPVYHERLKQSYYIIQSYFETID